MCLLLIRIDKNIHEMNSNLVIDIMIRNTHISEKGRNKSSLRSAVKSKCCNCNGSFQENNTILFMLPNFIHFCRIWDII